MVYERTRTLIRILSSATADAITYTTKTFSARVLQFSSTEHVVSADM